MRRLDPFFQTKHRFRILGSRNEALGDVYVLSGQYICQTLRARRGLKCVRMVSYR